MKRDEFMKKLEAIANAIYEFSHKKKKTNSIDKKEDIFSEILQEEIAL